MRLSQAHRRAASAQTHILRRPLPSWMTEPYARSAAMQEVGGNSTTAAARQQQQAAAAATRPSSAAIVPPYALHTEPTAQARPSTAAVQNRQPLWSWGH